MELLFTTTNKLTSRWIRALTREPVSHCAVRVGEFVIHSTFTGVIIEPYTVFARKNKVKFKVHYPTNPLDVRRTLHLYYGKMYDFGALFYLGLRYLLPNWMPKQNLWQTTGMFLCTEFVTQLINEKEDHLITPYKLYIRLKETGA